ncbi:ATP-dependent DNA helicase RecG, partial [Caballeronia sp. M23-90]
MPLSDRRSLVDPDAEIAPEAAGDADAPIQKPKRARARKLADLEIADKVQPLKPAAPPPKPVDKLAKLGLKSDIDLVLHLPMRYEDETTITPI